LVGANVTFTYLVTNAGNIRLLVSKTTGVVDDGGTPGTTADDFFGSYVSGDTNSDGFLDLGESWLFKSATMIVKNTSYTNVATVTGTEPRTQQTVTARDTAAYLGRTGAEGLTPGFWKNNADNKNAIAWPHNPDGTLVWSPGQAVSTMFSALITIGSPYADLSLADALGLGGGGIEALLRHGIAAVLGATSPFVAYPWTAAETIAAVNAAILAGDSNGIQNLKDKLEGFNKREADLDANGIIPAPSASISGGTAVTEGNSGSTAVTITVTLSGQAQTTVTMSWNSVDGSATAASGDYTGGTGTLTFLPGETVKTFNVFVKGDATFEPNETFSVQISGAAGAKIGTSSTTVTIANDEPAPPTLSISSVSVTEGNGGTTAATFTVTLSYTPTAPVTATWNTADGTATVASGDYAAASGVLTFGVGQTSQTVTVMVKGDTLFELNEMFTVVLSSPSGATIATGTGTGTIVNDDAKPTIALTGTTLSGAEQGQAPIVFTITRGANLADPLTVNLGWSGTAAWGTDYTVTASNGATLAGNGSTLLLPGGVASVTLTVTPADDPAVENAETVILTVGTSSSYTISGVVSQTGTIADNDKATVNVANLSKVEGNGGSGSPTSFVVTVTLSAPAAYAITVTLATAATPTPLPAGTTAATGAATLSTTGADYQSATFTVTFAAGQTSATVTVKVVGDKTKESNEVFNVNVTNSGAAIAGTDGTITILNDESPLNATSAGTATDAASTAPSASTLAAALEAAERSWIAAGVPAARFAGVTVALAELPGTILGLTAGSTIMLDLDAAGWGWSTDRSDANARNRIDLVSVLEHELGHVLGLEHGQGGVMDASLAPGVAIQASPLGYELRPAAIQRLRGVPALIHASHHGLARRPQAIRRLHQSTRGGRS
ncbi:MAG: Calx-beta domain-containing protein, partial [Gaiellaceae bacterium]